jgi:hypothetical protein
MGLVRRRTFVAAIGMREKNEFLKGSGIKPNQREEFDF